MTDAEAKKDELTRLEEIGYIVPETPSQREILTARMIDPAAWSKHSEEQIEWCKKNNLLHSPTHFGFMYMTNRRLSLVQAVRLLQHLDRQEEGKPDLEIFVARNISKDLEKKFWKMVYANDRKHASQRICIAKKAIDAVFLMNRIDGIPAPKVDLEDDGSVILTWSEDDREVKIHISNDGSAILKTNNEEDPDLSVRLFGWDNKEDKKLIFKMVHWVHFP